MMMPRFGSRWCLALAAFLVAGSPAAGADAASGSSVTRGITGAITVDDPAGLGLRPRADLPIDAPLLVRIVSREDRGADQGGGHRYRLEFIGTEAGVHDLRSVLERPGGVAVDDLDPIEVEVIRRLDAAAGTDVAPVDIPVPNIRGGYRATMITVGVAWGLVPLVIVGRRLARRPRDVGSRVDTSGPSLAERLEPLVAAAAAGTMSTEERGRLELLLIAHLDGGDETATPSRSRADAIAHLRRDAAAGPLLESVEAWLHRPGDNETIDSRRTRAAELLRPYRTVRATEIAS